ncbi:MAG: hypothetical protein ACI9VX_001599, partial [Dinoroseobacter sp.]
SQRPSVPANGLGQNGWGAGYLDEYTLLAALVFEVVSSFLFMAAIIDATGSGASPAMAGLQLASFGILSSRRSLVPLRLGWCSRQDCLTQKTRAATGCQNAGICSAAPLMGAAFSLARRF